MSEKPCAYCPAWEWLNDPTTVEGERAIRADQQRLNDRQLARMDAELHRERDRVELLETEIRRLKNELRRTA